MARVANAPTTKAPISYTIRLVAQMSSPTNVQALPRSICVYLLTIFAIISVPPLDALTRNSMVCPKAKINVYVAMSKTAFCVKEILFG